MKKPNCKLPSTLVVLALTVIQSLGQSIYEPYTFTTLAGNAGYGSADGMGIDARFWMPSGVAVDSAGNVYVADEYNHTLRKITPTGVVTTLAGLAGISGSADGMGSDARFGGISYNSGPSGVAVDRAGNVYVADKSNNTIRKVTPAGLVTTLAGLSHLDDQDPANLYPVGEYADGTGSVARFNQPSGVAVDGAGNVYVADTGNDRIRKVTPAGGVTTMAGVRGGSGVAVDASGNVYVADTRNDTIQKVTPAGVVTTLAGLGGGPGLAVDTGGNVYVAENGNNTIRKVTVTGEVTRLAGSAIDPAGSADGTESAARFNHPSGVAVDSAGNVYVADTSNHTIRKVTPTGTVTTLAGLARGDGSVDGVGRTARFVSPSGVAVDRTGNVYVADAENHTIRKVTMEGAVTTLAGQPGSYGSEDGTGGDARFGYPYGVAVDSSGNVYVTDEGNSTIRKVTQAGMVTTLAGLPLAHGGEDATGSAARFSAPSGVAVDSSGNVYVADTGNDTIRKITPAGVVATLAGLAGSSGSADGTGNTARFNSPSGVAVDSAGNVYVADTDNYTIRKVTPAGVVTTLAGSAGMLGSADGTGSAARFGFPFGVAVASTGNVYVADRFDNAIRKVTTAGVVTTLAGLAKCCYDLGVSGSADGTGSAARFFWPSSVAVDSVGNLYVADTYNGTIRKGYPAPRILASGPGLGFNGDKFGFNLTGPAGRLVVVETSTDLARWLPIWTNTFTFPAALNFSDAQNTVSSHRFYRTHLP